MYVRSCLLQVYRWRTGELELDFPKNKALACLLLSVPLYYLGVMSARPPVLLWRGPDLISAAARLHLSTSTSWTLSRYWLLQLLVKP